MTIDERWLKHRNIRHVCGAEQGCYLEKHIPDWGPFNHCFTGAARPTDLDGVIERDGNILFLEWKNTGAPVKTGQRMLLEALARKSCQSVLILWGDHAEDINQAQRLSWFDGTGGKIEPADYWQVCDWLKGWWEYANRNRRRW